jgi:hypothetical protein
MFLILAVASGAGCGRSLATMAPSLATGATRSATSPTAAESPMIDKEDQEYRQQILQRFLKKDYSWIDQEADRVRASKERLPGGYWKLRAVYGALEKPTTEKASDGDWDDLLQSLTAWVNAKPKSITARVALATAWKGYAWKARGNGYADKVDEASWEAFRKRLEKSQEVLSQAAQLNQQCPFWFVTALWVGIGQQWDRASLEKLFDAGVKLEPTFYYIYQAKAVYLLPRWGGQPGGWERFADEAALKLGGHQGDIIFFTIYSQMLSMHDVTFMNTHHAAVPRLISGFRSIEKLYGSSAHRLNEACFFATSGNDSQAKAEFFSRIGEDFDPTVWRWKQSYEISRQGFQLQQQREKSKQNSAPVQTAPGNPNH